MTDEVANTSERGLTLDQAVQRLQERRKAQAAPAVAAPKNTGQADNDASDDLDDSISDEEVVQSPKLGKEDAEGSNAEGVGETGEGEEDGDEEVFIVTVKDDTGADVEKEVPAEELVKGYMRQEDYTRKRTKEAAEHKAKIQSVSKLESDLGLALQGVVAQMTQDLDQYRSIDWQALQSSDPITYATKKLAYIEAQGNVQKRYAQIMQLKEYRENREAELLNSRIEEETQVLRNVVPNWDTRKQELVAYLKEQGITDLTPFVPASMALLVHKAKQFDDLQQKTQTLVKKKLSRKVPGTLGTGTTQSKHEIDQELISKLKEQARKSGKIEDAIALRRAQRGQ